jgi:hypothetical protein
MQPFPALESHGPDEAPGAGCLLVCPSCDEIMAHEPGYYVCPQCHYGLCDDYAPSETEALLGQVAD